MSKFYFYRDLLGIVLTSLLFVLFVNEMTKKDSLVLYRTNIAASVDPNATCNIHWNPLGVNITAYEKHPKSILSKMTALNSPSDTFVGNRTSSSREKFLLPVLHFGPNNQLIGLRESIYAAMSLKRTLVLPAFWKHRTDRQRGGEFSSFISPNHRVDLETLCSYIPCVTMDEFRKICHYKIDGIVALRRVHEKTLQTLEDKIKMRILPSKDNKSMFRKKLIPKLKKHTTLTRKRFLSEQIQKKFHSSKKCVIYIRPFMNLLAYNSSETLHSRVRKKLLTGEELLADERQMSSIIQHTTSPKYIVGLAREFISVVFLEKPFIAVHWRYNAGDFLTGHFCSTSKVTQKTCARAKTFTSWDFVLRIIRKLHELKMSGTLVKQVYIASPPTERKFISEVSSILKKKRMKVASSAQLEQYLKSHHKGCYFLSRHLNDILSTTEMEICSAAILFLGPIRRRPGIIAYHDE